jgi:aspartyl-tRNA synthetase
MHAYRTHTCAALRATDAGATVRLSGWVHRKRDHGGVLFMDIRDHYGLTQCVVGQGSPVFAEADALRPESVVTITGEVVRRQGATVNPKLPTGEVEVRVRELVVQSEAAVLPIQVAGEAEFPETCGSATAFSTSGGSGSTATSCCAPASSRPSGAA